METKKITILQKDFEEMEGLYDSFYEIYGNRNTVWDLQDLDEMRIIGQWISDIIKDRTNIELQQQIKNKVKELCAKFPVYEGL